MNRTLLKLSTAALFLLASAAPAAADTVTLRPGADSYVSQAAPTGSYGTDPKLRVDGSPDIRSYLRFDLTPLGTASVVKATLRLRPNSSSSGGYAVRSVADVSWTEGSLRYGNAPAMGATGIGSGPVTAGTPSAVDVTSLVRAGDPIGLGLTTPSATAISFGSRESTTPPELVVETAAAPVVVAAGDIACSPQSGYFNGGLGTSTKCRQSAVSDLIVGISPTAVLSLGDHRVPGRRPHRFPAGPTT